MTKGEQAVAYKHGGMNCCQAVLRAFQPESGLDAETLGKLGAAFGVGMGCFETTCGALVAAGMLLGLGTYRGAPVLRDAKGLVQGFQARCGATRCADLKGLATGQVLCPCDDCVRAACALCEEFFQKTDFPS